MFCTFLLGYCPLGRSAVSTGDPGSNLVFAGIYRHESAAVSTLEGPDCVAAQGHGPRKPRPAGHIRSLPTDGWPYACPYPQQHPDVLPNQLSLNPWASYLCILFPKLPPWPPWRAPCPVPRGLSPTPTHARMCLVHGAPRSEGILVHSSVVNIPKSFVIFDRAPPCSHFATGVSPRLSVLLEWSFLSPGSPQGRLPSFLYEVPRHACSSRLSPSPPGPLTQRTHPTPAPSSVDGTRSSPLS